MAWIEAHQKLQSDPKMLALAEIMDWTPHECIGRLLCFWWWCVDHCPNGDLRQCNDSTLAHVVALDRAQAKSFVDAMVKTGWVEREPWFRVRNWWKFVRAFMQKRYERQPDKWRAIRDAYEQTVDPQQKCGSAAGPPRDRYGPVQYTDKDKDKDRKKESARARDPIPLVKPPKDAGIGRKHDVARGVLEHLNTAAGRHYRAVEANLKPIAARLEEVENDDAGVRRMIDRQVALWKGTEMAEYLRPETLFRASKFPGYYDNRDQPTNHKIDPGEARRVREHYGINLKQ